MYPEKEEVSTDASSDQQLRAELLRAVKSATERAFAQSKQQLKEVMRETLGMLRTEFLAVVSEESRMLRAEMHDLLSGVNVNDTGDFRMAMKEQLDLIKNKVYSLVQKEETIVSTDAPESQSTLLEGKIAALGQRVQTLQAGLVLEADKLRSATFLCQSACSAVDELRQQAHTEGHATFISAAPEDSQVGAALAGLGAELHRLQTGLSTDAEKMQSTRLLCESARSSVETLHLEVTHHCEDLRKTMAILQDMENFSTSPRHSSRLYSIDTEPALNDLRARILKHSEELESVCRKWVEFQDDHRRHFLACTEAQDKMRTGLSDLKRAFCVSAV